MRIRSYALRGDSGGAGLHPGGEGVVREYEALEKVQVSLITERRRHAPKGVRGGAEGAVGKNSVNGRPLGGRAAISLEPGDVLRIDTPGGGGWGAPESA